MAPHDENPFVDPSNDDDDNRPHITETVINIINDDHNAPNSVPNSASDSADKIVPNSAFHSVPNSAHDSVLSEESEHITETLINLIVTDDDDDKPVGEGGRSRTARIVGFRRPSRGARVVVVGKGEGKRLKGEEGGRKGDAEGEAAGEMEEEEEEKKEVKKNDSSSGQGEAVLAEEVRYVKPVGGAKIVDVVKKTQ